MSDSGGSVEKDLEVGSHSSATLDLPAHRKKSLSRAFLSTGMPVTFKVPAHKPSPIVGRGALVGLPAALAARGKLTCRAPCPPQDLTYTVINSQNKKETLSLLEGVSGYLLQGQMTALMG